MFGSWWVGLDLSPASALVSEASRAEVQGVVERYEWMGNLPDNCSRYAKLTFDGNVAGAVAFSRSGFGGSFTYLGNEAWKLARGVTLHWAPTWASSALISRSLRLLFDDPTFVVAFSDWEAGEVGTVYQASGWVYLGHRPSLEWASPSGERKDASFHKVRVVSGSRHRRTGATATREQYDATARDMLDNGWSFRRVIRGKYATVAGRRGRERRHLEALLAEQAKDYPRRAGGVNGARASHTSEEGGVRSPDRAPLTDGPTL